VLMFCCRNIKGIRTGDDGGDSGGGGGGGCGGGCDGDDGNDSNDSNDDNNRTTDAETERSISESVALSNEAWFFAFLDPGSVRVSSGQLNSSVI